MSLYDGYIPTITPERATSAFLAMRLLLEEAIEDFNKGLTTSMGWVNRAERLLEKLDGSTTTDVGLNTRAGGMHTNCAPGTRPLGF